MVLGGIVRATKGLGASLQLSRILLVPFGVIFPAGGCLQQYSYLQDESGIMDSKRRGRAAPSDNALSSNSVPFVVSSLAVCRCSHFSQDQ